MNKEKCKSKIFNYLYANQGKNEMLISDVMNSVPPAIVSNLPEHFNDILQELLDDNNVKGKISGNKLILQ
jgi:hypothetical protein